jgi:hypothetical protein
VVRTDRAPRAPRPGAGLSVPAIIRLAPILRLEDLDELRRRGRDVYDHGTFRPLLQEEPIPVVVDHGERATGHVREFAYRAAPEGGTWCFAHCLLDDPPGWLRRGTPASFESVLRRTIDLGGIEGVVDQRVTEVTLCSSSFGAVEPLARVEWVGEPSKDSPANRGAGEIPSPGVRIRRYSGSVLGVR